MPWKSGCPSRPGRAWSPLRLPTPRPRPNASSDRAAETVRGGGRQCAGYRRAVDLRPVRRQNSRGHPQPAQDFDLQADWAPPPRSASRGRRWRGRLEEEDCARKTRHAGAACLSAAGHGRRRAAARRHLRKDEPRAISKQVSSVRSRPCCRRRVSVPCGAEGSGTRAGALPAQRPGARLAPVVLPLAEHSRRRAARGRRGRSAQDAGGVARQVNACSPTRSRRAS